MRIRDIKLGLETFTKQRYVCCIDVDELKIENGIQRGSLVSVPKVMTEPKRGNAPPSISNLR